MQEYNKLRLSASLGHFTQAHIVYVKPPPPPPKPPSTWWQSLAWGTTAWNGLFKVGLAGIGFLTGWYTDNTPVQIAFPVGFLLLGWLIEYGLRSARGMDKYIYFNVAMFALHIGAGAAFFYIARDDQWSTRVTLSRTVWDTTNSTKGATCDDPGTTCFIVQRPCVVSPVSIEFIVLLFHPISGFSHYVCAFGAPFLPVLSLAGIISIGMDAQLWYVPPLLFALGGLLDLALWPESWRYDYDKALQERNHWVRWWTDYIFSASLMSGTFALLCGINDVVALLPIMGGVATTQLFGYLSDKWLQGKWTPDGAARVSDEARRVFWLGWIPYVACGWLVVFWVFIDSINHPGKNLSPPKLLYVVIFSQFAFFSSFAIAQWVALGPGKDDYKTGEWIFLVLSLLSKSTLATSLFLAAQGRLELGVKDMTALDAFDCY